MKKNYLTIIIITVLFFPISALAEDNLRITFINPGFSDKDNPTGEFWLSVSSFMKAAAEDLNIDLEIIYSDRNHIKMKEIAKKIVARKIPPDYLLVVNEKFSAEKIVEDAEKRNVKVFVMLNRFEGDQNKKMGQPRGKYKNWIGTLIPDNRYAGYQIAKLLIDHSLKAGVKADDGRLYLLGYAGDLVTQASVERVEGLKQAVSEYPDVDLKQVISCNWSKDEAKYKTPLFLKRYPQIGAIWGANDPIAIGAIEGAVAAGKTPGKNIFFGGLNWDAPGLEKVKNGEMVTSLGGHFMTGAWALILLYDYHHGKDFVNEGTQLKYKIFRALHKQNINHFLSKFGDRNWGKIDFTKFSKALNPNISKYDFNLETLLE
jgi:ABC-type sugar transport system substrate-binding protein